MSRDAEKLPLLDDSNSDSTPSRRIRTTIWRLAVPTIALFGFVYLQLAATYELTQAAELCHQPEIYIPQANEAVDANQGLIFSPDFRKRSAEILSGFVQVKSPSFDDLGKVGGDNGDQRWDAFYEVSTYLNQTFPQVYETLSLTKVNTHGVVLEWRGTHRDLKPSLLAGHLDVVPVDPSTLDKWTWPPWQGHYDGEYLWGRGSVDDKHAVSAILEAVTLLIEKGFKPQRTLVLAFGFDEESKGRNGAGHINQYLEEKYGKDGIAVIVDEGGLGLGEQFGANFAIPATGEKGYVDVKFSLSTPGGHSSIPPDHTSIGIMAQLITSLEANPFKPLLPLESPVFSLLSCAAEHGHLPSSLKRNVKRGAKSGRHGAKAREEAALEVAALGKASRYLVQTSQAIDIIKAGVKVNALPESVELVANYRVAVGSSVEAVKEHIAALVRPVADRFELSIELFGSQMTRAGESGGHIKVVSINELQPAPVSPTSGSVAWDVLAGTIRHTLDRDDQLVVAPAIMTGNTDTRYYWNLSKNIYRFTPINRAKSINLHTVDERLLFQDHIDAIWFFHELVRSYDEAEI
ncbi:M20 family metallopeptidase [Sporobolomyces koalae]|uniref:M20 family metallopeptidase n=1 Tax=Sporobolomyces koalae TaxID=500713 RepID=UPI00317CA0FA